MVKIAKVFLGFIGFSVLLLAPQDARGLLGQALSVDGVGDYIEIADAPDLYLRDALTVSGWFRADSFKAGSDGWQALFWKGAAPDHAPYNKREFGLWLHESGMLELDALALVQAEVGSIRKISTRRGVLQEGQWYHFATVLSAADGYMRIYLTGKSVAEGAFDQASIRDTAGSLRIGGIDDRDYFRGLIDEVRIWNRALSAREIHLNMNRQLTGDEEGLVAYYSFDGLNEDGALPDMANKGHVGKLYGDARLVPLHVLMPPVAGTHVDSAALELLIPSEGFAASHVGSIGGEAADLLILALKHHDPGVRRRAAKALHKVAAEDFSRVMHVALYHHDSEVRRRAASALSYRDFGALPADLQPLAARENIVVDGGRVQVEVETLGAKSRPWDPNAYRGWEQRWYEPHTTFWNLEPKGLLGRYNRVEGGYISWHLPRTYHPGSGLANYGEVGYSSGREEFSYRAGAELFSFYHSANAGDNLVTIGAELHDIVDSQDGWLIAQEENSVDALLFRRDFRDYYRRTGWSAYSTHNFRGVLQVTGRYGMDDFESLETQIDGVMVGNRFARDAFRLNPAVDEIQVRSLRTDVQLDTRDRRQRPKRGFFANAHFERAGGFLGGDVEFKRYVGDLRRYQPVGRGTRVDMWLRLATAKGVLPSQYTYDLGGLGSLRGYDFKQFSGDRMVLFNAEYWVDADAHWRGQAPMDDMGLGVFFDMGSAWWANDPRNPFDQLDALVGQGGVGEEMELVKTLGFAVALEDIRLDLARPLDGEEDTWEFSLRFGRAF